MAHMPHLSAVLAGGVQRELVPSFPCVTWPVQAAIVTGRLPCEHGVVANGFYWREQQRVEMWTAWNDTIQAPQVWDMLKQQRPELVSAVWFPMLAKGCGADVVCAPAPIHNPDGSESMWCYTKPQDLYDALIDALGHFPLQHFWGPLAGIQSSRWIVDSAVMAASRYRPHFWYIYLPHLDYAAQRSGPDSAAADTAVVELDEVIGTLVDRFRSVYREGEPLWLVASEYVVTPVRHVCYPNRLLRQAGLLAVGGKDVADLDVAASRAWCLVDHQFSHVFVRDPDAGVVSEVGALFGQQEGIGEVLVGEERGKYGMVHERAGDVILVSRPDSWQAYYWWFEADRAPPYARTVDIHRKPGYDPVELFWDRAAKGVPLDAALVRGSHGAPATNSEQTGLLAISQPGFMVDERPVRDVELAGMILAQFGIERSAWKG